ncbi:MAG TPA: hypothetical protein VNW90_08590 [Acetobacteraceae bacterium]|nr:hypothetical protein [Acetobacteraceae bacterium]
MAAPPTAAVPADRPDPDQDRQATGTDAPTSTGHLLRLVRALIDYGKQLATTLQQRTASTSLTAITRNFGTIDIGEILARITRGLLRAAALEARLDQRPPPRHAAPAAVTAPSHRQPRTAPRLDPSASASAAEPRTVRLPTPAEIAAQVRRRPIGAVLADICRDLGITTAHPLWRELSLLIIANDGSLASLTKDIFKRVSVWLIDPPATEYPAQPPPHLPAAFAPATGPP